MSAPWRVAADRLVVTVRLTPKGGRDAIDGVERLADGVAVLKARVRAAAHEGAANAALQTLLAKTLGVAPSRVRLVAGAGARIKTVEIEGDGPSLAARLEALSNRTVA